MQQRASIVRALAQTAVLLMDEPFGALDAFTRDEMNLLLLRLWAESGKTIVFVTHNISEAIFLGDRVIVLTPRPGGSPASSRSTCRGRGRSRCRSSLASSRRSRRSSGSSSRAAATGWRSSERGPERAPRRVPTFEDAPGRASTVRSTGPGSSIRTAKTALEIGAIVALFAAVFFGVELILRVTDTPTYVFPKPTATVKTLFADFGTLYAPHLWVTMQEFLIGLAIGASIGLLLAARSPRSRLPRR